MTTLIQYLDYSFEIEEHIFNNSSKKVDIVLPVWNNVGLAKYAIKSIQKFTNKDLYNLYIINNGSSAPDFDEFIKNIINNQRNNPKTNINIVINKTAPKDWRGSNGHALALNLSVPMTTSENLFIMHDDSAPLENGWLDFMLGKMSDGNDVVGTYTNWSKNGIDYLHCSGLLISKKFIIENQIDFSPKKPEYDTAGMVSKKLIETSTKYFVMKNSRNNPDLRKFHLYEHERGSESFDDNLKPIFSHQGRGSSNLSTSGDRGGWIRSL